MREAAKIRNIALIGHSGEGKTSAAEAMLFCAKVIDRMGKISDGNTVMDFDAEEIARGISISLAIANFEWDGYKINIIDVPGFFDFEGEMIQALQVADGAVIVTSASGSVTVGTEKAIDYCLKNRIPAMIFINQMDKENADYAGTVEALKAKYLNKIAPIQIPIMEGNKMTGYVSLISQKAYELKDSGRAEIAIPDNLKADFDNLKENLKEVAASNDDDLMTKYFDGDELTKDEIIMGLAKGVEAADAIPVLAGSAYQNKGIINLLNQIVRLIPDPTVKKFKAKKDGQELELTAASNEGLVCQVFKTISDPFVGKLTLFRVICGALKPGVNIYNPVAQKSEKAASFFTMKGKKQEPVDALGAGDIGAFAKLQFTRTGDTITDGSKIVLEPVKLPEPVFTMAVTCLKQGDEEKVFGGLSKLIEEDATAQVTRNPETSETLISGLGETQIDVLTKKLKNKFGVEAKLVDPRVPYRETIKKISVAEGKHKKQSGGHGQYGHCKIMFEPYYEGDFLFAETIVGGSVPKQYIPAVEKGLLESIAHGVLAGYPVVNIKCTLQDGSYHEVDSSEMAFKIAASLAFKKGMAEAAPTILEPIYSYKITVPESYLGDIMGDMNRRRGRILGMSLEDGKQIINAEAPLAEMFKYATDLRSMTQGRGSFVCKFERYEEVPANLIPAIIAASPYKKGAEED
ncbi:MAG: elongation factor G [Clostridiales bacterium]|jgi:elongation factor G|nr:elongation factor G [Clostridiales bacterium]